MAFPLTSATNSCKSGVLCAALKSFHQVSRLLWAHENDWELRTFYAQLMAYFLMIGERSKRITRTTSEAIDDPATQMAELLQSCITATDFLCGTTATSRLSFFNQALAALPDSPISKLDFIRRHIHFGSTPEERTAFIRVLDSWEREAKSIFPDDVRDEALDEAPELQALPEPPYGVSMATTSVFAALLGCKACSCSPSHDLGANLGLRTHRRPDCQDDAVFDFDIVLSRAHDLYEAHARTVRKKVVQWTQEARGRPLHTKKRNDHRQLIKQLCEPINKMNLKKPRPYRLELEVEETRLYKLQSNRDFSTLDSARGPTSLKHLLRHQKDSFTERTKRILAILFGYAVLYLVDTPWLPTDWNSSNVLFYHTTSSEVPLYPFLGSRLRLETHDTGLESHVNGSSDTGSDIDPDELDPDDCLPHDSPTIVALAIVLMEVFTATPFEELASRYGVELTSGLSQPGIWFDAIKLSKECEGEIPHSWCKIVNSCLDPQTWETEDDDGNLLDSSALRARIYEQVIRPLEQDLTQAFPDVSLEGLDELARGLDLNRWGLHRKLDKPVFTLPVHQHLHAMDHRPAHQLPDSLPFSPKRASTTYSLSHQHNTNDHSSPSTFSPPSPAKRYTEPNLHGNQSWKTQEEAIPGHGRSIPHLYSKQMKFEDYTVGVVCAMSFEMSAVRYMLDQEHPDLPTKHGDSNIYTLGDLHGHNVVLACLPGQQGKSAAATVAANMARTFPSIKWNFLVGIGGGVPSTKNDIRLGDVVVSMPEGPYGGVVQYDLGKDTDTNFQLKGFMWPPPPLLRSAAEKMRSDHFLRDNRVSEYVSTMIRDQQRLAIYQRPADVDVLFREDYSHAVAGSSCAGCDLSKAVDRPSRAPGYPVIHYGLIASGDRVLKSTKRRAEAVQGLGDVLCFEMEAGGAMSETPCIVIRGISDYADSHKNNNWHHYAAATAAACAKELLSFVDP